jgi:RES domain-containing protein
MSSRGEHSPTLRAKSIPADWRSVPAPFALKRIGHDWVESMRSCILEVPSVVAPHESNFILNPGHPDFASLEIGDTKRLETDPRLS